MREANKIISPMVKYNNPDITGLAPIQSERISVKAVKIPPRACPADIAVMYFGEKRPATPIRLPVNIAPAAENFFFKYYHSYICVE